MHQKVSIDINMHTKLFNILILKTLLTKNYVIIIIKTSKKKEKKTHIAKSNTQLLIYLIYIEKSHPIGRNFHHRLQLSLQLKHCFVHIDAADLFKKIDSLIRYSR